MGSTSKRSIRRRQQHEATQAAVGETPKREITRRGSAASNDDQDQALKKQAETTARIKEAIVHTPLQTDIPGFPRNERPWSLANGEGKVVLSANAPTDLSPTGNGNIIIEIDPGAFRWLWEGVETRALDNYRRYHGNTDDIADAATRALAAIRKAGLVNWRSKYPHLNATKKKRVIKKRSQSEETKTKRVIRRKK